jgi:hypothetical protein
MKRLMASGAAAAVASGASGQDAVQWRVQDGGNGHWYKVVQQARLWSDAKVAAEAIGGYLATTTSSSELLAIRPLLTVDGGTHDFFIGARRQSNSSPWQWVTGERFSYTAWEPGAPDNGPESLCLEVVGRSVIAGNRNPGFGLWNDETEYAAGGGQWFIAEFSADCNNDGIVDYGQIRNGSLVDADANNIPDCCEQGSPCPLAALEWSVSAGGNGHWYALKRVLPSQSPESLFALSMQIGGYAATISSEAENAFCSQFVVPWDPTLIGVRKLQGTNQVAWVTGEPVTFVNWNTGEGTNLGERYAAIIPTSGRWTDTDLTPRQVVLVEFSADCNNDGIVDYGQIRAGELADTNANNIPDCCENATPCGCAGDTNLDASVDGIDLATVLTRWAQPAAKFPEADCNRDGVIDGADLAIVLGSWGACP